MKSLSDKSVVNRQDEALQKISPFELKNRLIEMASDSIRKNTHVMLNAGRGNPNWIATEPREAFFALGFFGVAECRRVMSFPEGIAGIPDKEGIAHRFESFLKGQEGKPGIDLLKRTYNYMLMEHSADPDELVHEWAECVCGDQYPVPDRIMKYTQLMVRDYLDLTMCNSNPPKGKYDLFATEGGTAAMCYAFDSLQQNFLLRHGDSIAVMIPIFTPYIEIPELARYDFDVLNISADTMDKDGYHTWQFKVEDINKLRDPKYKALFLINPTNPPSYEINKECIDAIKDVVDRWNPNLMILTDDVYGTFVPGFRSLMAELPYNTICVYSFSKYFGATGWRLATIAIHEDNLFDKLIANLPRKRKGELAKRYASLTPDVEKMKFIDRMVADSRQVALNHTSGLSLPQQMQMTLFASFEVLDTEKKYRKAMLNLIHTRLKALWDNMQFTLPEDPLRAGYYSEIDMLIWANKFYGAEFVDYLKKTYNPIDIVLRLATETGLVVLNGGGFDGPEWSIRVSLANLNEADYVLIGKGIRQILTEYAEAWKASQK